VIDEDALNIFTDGSSFSAPRAGGIAAYSRTVGGPMATSSEAELNREIREVVVRFSRTLPDEVIAGALVSNAFLVSLRQDDVDAASRRIGSIADVLRSYSVHRSPAAAAREQPWSAVAYRGFFVGRSVPKNSRNLAEIPL
jgi:hypothetical protein